MESDFQSIYLHSSEWDARLSPSIQPPNLRLVEHGGELWLQETTSAKLINVGNRHLLKLGIWTAQVRGVHYYAEAAKRAELSPGSSVELVREPENAVDPRAVAIRAGGPTIGYVNKQMATRLYSLLDGGTVLAAVSIAGGAAGQDNDRVRVLAASPALLRHLLGEQVQRDTAPKVGAAVRPGPAPAAGGKTRRSLWKWWG